MSGRPRHGLLLTNLGTPDSTRIPDVRRYLREFLMDPRVIDVPLPQRWLIVHLFILPFRPKRSAEAYEQIWTDAGSPLLIHGRELTRKVQLRLGDEVDVALAMRYGNPSVRDALAGYLRRGVERVTVLPLYPQYSGATTKSTRDKVVSEAARAGGGLELSFAPPFYSHPAFIDAFARVARPAIERARPELVFLSFHGLPERQITKADPTGAHCLRTADCCREITAANRDCYRAQCYATARLLRERLELAEDRAIVCFQSRLGRTPWIRPYTDEVLAEQARRGCRRALILSPSFVADCLETLEELGIRGLETWKEHGGESLELAPCLNADDAWADAVVRIAKEAGLP